MNYLSVDIDGVTVTIRAEDVRRFIDLVPVSESDFYEGWVTKENPSPSSVGFAVSFEDFGKVHADFHNLPFYYKDQWDSYHARIVQRARRHEDFKEWNGHADRFEARLLATLIEILGEVFEPDDPQALLSRVDFEDDFYRLLRVIDGDTIVVEPPKPLRRWMKDIRVRLYGLETPELWETLGDQYKRHLEDLCSEDGGGRLSIVWERERLGTQYAGYPKVNFERAIGHVFFRQLPGRYLYANGLMLSLRHSSHDIRGRSILRGSTYLTRLEFRLPWSGNCATALKCESDPSYTMSLVGSMRPPLCLLSYPALPRLDPRRSTFESDLVAAVKRAWSLHCPFQAALQSAIEELWPAINDLRASPFDVPLTFLGSWATRHWSAFR